MTIRCPQRTLPTLPAAQNLADTQRTVLLRSYVTTNYIPGHVGAPDVTPQVDSNGFLEFQPTPAVAIRHAPMVEIVTNYVLGYRQGTETVEVMTTRNR